MPDTPAVGDGYTVAPAPITDISDPSPEIALMMWAARESDAYVAGALIAVAGLVADAPRTAALVAEASPRLWSPPTPGDGIGPATRAAADALRLRQTVTLTGEIDTITLEDGRGGTLPAGEVRVTLHLRGTTRPEPADA